MDEALEQQTLIKIDIWARINGRYLEITNFFMLEAGDRQGKKLAQFTKSLPNYEESIAADVRMYSNPETRKTLKALKRLWSLALFTENYELAGQISPIFKTRSAGLNQIVGETEVLIMMLQRLPDPPLKQIIEQIDGFKPRIDQLNEDYDNSLLFSIINSITLPFYNDNKVDLTTIISSLEQFKNIISEIVEKKIYNEASELGLQNPASFL